MVNFSFIRSGFSPVHASNCSLEWQMSAFGNHRHPPQWCLSFRYNNKLILGNLDLILLQRIGAVIRMPFPVNIAPTYACRMSCSLLTIEFISMINLYEWVNENQGLNVRWTASRPGMNGHSCTSILRRYDLWMVYIRHLPVWALGTLEPPPLKLVNELDQLQNKYLFRLLLRHSSIPYDGARRVYYFRVLGVGHASTSSLKRFRRKLILRHDRVKDGARNLLFGWLI